MTDENDDDLPPSPRDEATSTRLAHDVYLRAVNNPVRRRILEIIATGPCSVCRLGERLIREEIIHEPGSLKYHLDYLKKAKCIELHQDDSGKEQVVTITREGKVVDFMEK
jgi:DNA-binding transcriptional ArsR family regulator